MSVKTQGTQLFVIDPLGTGGNEIIAIECTTALSGLGAPREQIETTCLEGDSREYVAGLPTPGQLSVTLNFDPANESHFRLYELWKSGVNFDGAIGYSDGATTIVPTLDTDGEFDFPTTRSFALFNGYVVDLPQDFSLNAVVTATVPIQLSGAYEIIRKA